MVCLASWVRKRRGLLMLFDFLDFRLECRFSLSCSGWNAFSNFPSCSGCVSPCRSFSRLQGCMVRWKHGCSRVGSYPVQCLGSVATPQWACAGSRSLAGLSLKAHFRIGSTPSCPASFILRPHLEAVSGRLSCPGWRVSWPQSVFPIKRRWSLRWQGRLRWFKARKLPCR